jgi:hypothetical protein
MKTSVKILILTVFLELCFIDCRDNDKDKPFSDAALIYNQWKLAAFVYGEDGTSKIPESVSRNSYVITFNRDNTLFGQSHPNAIVGVYEINQQLLNIKINADFASEAMELLPDGELFLKKLNSSYRYLVTENTLKLYSTENDYLLLNIYEDEK